jgi:5-oxopent-3-ene-1,2,5-tricarboxylate decarboxylase/2-hydroxyhepta-2,4-diene-1,7-dioate isomerase
VRMTQVAHGSTGTVVAVHLNYRSRAAERGRTPDFPSYFLKPSSSVAGSGDPVRRPAGCELLSFEGEVALVIGRTAHRVTRGEAWSHVGHVTAANDFGVYDLRYADSGSNLRSKGPDGFTPIGPMFIAADLLDPADLMLRTWVDGELRQEAKLGEDLIFGFDQIVADLSRLMTLRPGDVILTGTPHGASVVEPGSVVEVEVTAGAHTSGRLISPVVQDDRPLERIGAMPRLDDATRALAFGTTSTPDVPGDLGPGPTHASAATLSDRLGRCSTATLSAQLRKRGLDGCTFAGVHPVGSAAKFVGRARTVEYLPLREDLFSERGGGFNAQKQAVDDLAPGDVLVISARGDISAGTIGDILVLRAERLGAVAVLTDGAVRDHEAIRSMAIPVHAAGANPAVLGRRHVPWRTDVAVACGGVLVEPGDLLVGDEDGVVLVPATIAAEVADDAAEQELEERFIIEQVSAGASVEGLYPVTQRWRAAFETWRVRTEQT